MAKRKSKSVASESRLFVLALGLLVGFVIAFVILLSRLPVDSVISQYNDDATRGAEVVEMNFDYYAVLEAQKAARKPAVTVPPAVVEPAVVFVEPSANVQPRIIQTPAAPANVPRESSRPRKELPSTQSGVQPPLAAQQPLPRLESPPPPTVLSAPRVLPKPGEPARHAEPVREMLATGTGQDSYYVEAGNYQDNFEALKAQMVLRKLGLEAFIVVRQNKLGGFGHRVRIGPFFEQSRLDITRARLRANGITAKLIRVKG